MLAAFERWGPESALGRFNGMFAFALWDRDERTLYLARDRLGEKPLYYGWIGRRFVFASEIKALRVDPDFAPEIDPQALAAFLRRDYIPHPRSIYRGLSKLAPASWLRVEAERGASAEIPYWSARRAAEQGCAAPFSGSVEEAREQLEAVLGDAVRLRMVADVPLGAFLSGGVDSSTVVALMQRHSRRPVRTFTIGFREGTFNEADHARAVARHLGTEHTELFVTPREALDVIPQLPALYDEPFADPSQIPTFLVSRLARHQVTVALSGDGGDELFGGYNSYFRALRLWRRLRRVPLVARAVASQLLTIPSPAQWRGLLEPVGRLAPSRLRRRLDAGRIRKFALLLAAPDSDHMYQALLAHPDGLLAAKPADPPRLPVPPLPEFAHRMMFRDLVDYLPDDILVKLDRASMGVSLESRVPLLDPRVVDLAWRLPLALKMRHGRGKWILRQVLYRYVPAELVARPKTGFGVPVGEWLRGPLRSWAEELLAEGRLRRQGCLDSVAVRRIWQEHLAGADCLAPLWNVLMFEAWSEAQATAPLPAGLPTC
jgi:asparagine synthase (glutamine-hydrolysing)